MDEKKYFFKTIIYCLGVLAVIAALIIIIDPFVHYHSPFFGLAVTETDERGQQIGVAKNTDYDTALIGSSMSENFVASWFNDGVLGNSSVKLCMQGAHFDDFSRLLNVVLSKNTTKRVIFSLDNYVVMNVPKDYPTTIPEYLENDTITDDAYYVWNKSVAMYYLPLFIWNNISEGFSSDTAYVWSDDYAFDKYVALATYTPVRLLKQADEEPYDTYFPYAYELIDSVTPYIEAHPDVEFIFYAPPYSILYWDDSVLHGRLTAEICALNEVYGALLSHPNVRLFYFQDDWDIITNLNNYKDYSHYSKDINRYMYESMRDGNKEVFADTYFDILLKFSEDVADYDFESAFH